MQPRKLLRRHSPKRAKRALLANNVTREFGQFCYNSVSVVDTSILQGLTTRTRSSRVRDFENYTAFLDTFDQIIAEKQKSPPKPQEWIIFKPRP